MPLADELATLDALHTKGALTDDEYQRAKARLLDAAAQDHAPRKPPSRGVEAVNNLRRSLTDRWIGGVCGGLALSTGLESWVWRLIFAVLLVMGGAGLILYLLLWLFVPSE